MKVAFPVQPVRRLRVGRRLRWPGFGFRIFVDELPRKRPQGSCIFLPEEIGGLRGSLRS